MRRVAPRSALLGVLCILLAAPWVGLGAAGAESRASLTDVEDEVMCPICGTLLELSQSPQAERERVFIRKLIARGETKEQIKDALVAEYGRAVLAVPGDSGFDLSAYLVPVVAFVLGTIALAVGILRWRRGAARSEPDEAPPAAPTGEDAARLESDLARYDL